MPVINKIDLPSADPDRVIEEIEDVIGIPAEDAPKISAKQGINIHAVLEKIVSDIPAPTGDVNAPLRALIFDSYYAATKELSFMFVLKRDRFTRVTNLNLWQQEVHSPLWNVVLCMPHQWNLPRTLRR